MFSTFYFISYSRSLCYSTDATNIRALKVCRCSRFLGNEFHTLRQIDHIQFLLLLNVFSLKNIPQSLEMTLINT